MGLAGRKNLGWREERRKEEKKKPGPAIQVATSQTGSRTYKMKKKVKGPEAKCG